MYFSILVSGQKSKRNCLFTRQNEETIRANPWKLKQEFIFLYISTMNFSIMIFFSLQIHKMQNTLSFLFFDK